MKGGKRGEGRRGGRKRRKGGGMVGVEVVGDGR